MKDSSTPNILLSCVWPKHVEPCQTDLLYRQLIICLKSLNHAYPAWHCQIFTNRSTFLKGCLNEYRQISFLGGDENTYLAHCEDHHIEDFNLAFSKFDAIHALCASKKIPPLVLLADVDSIFLRSSKFVNFVKQKHYFSAINYADEQSEGQQLGTIIEWLNKCTGICMERSKKNLNPAWINSGFILADANTLAWIKEWSISLVKTFRTEPQWIKEKTGGHYGDEIVFSALYEYCGNHKEISCKSTGRSAAVFWTVPTQRPTLKILTPWQCHGHLHLPDIKYDAKRLALLEEWIDAKNASWKIILKLNHLAIKQRLPEWLKKIIGPAAYARLKHAKTPGNNS